MCLSRDCAAKNFRYESRSRVFVSSPSAWSAVTTPRVASLSGLWSMKSAFQIASDCSFFESFQYVSVGMSEARKNSAMR